VELYFPPDAYGGNILQDAVSVNKTFMADERFVAAGVRFRKLEYMVHSFIFLAARCGNAS